MISLKRKMTALVLALMILAATVVIPGCKKEKPTTPTTPAPSKQKLPDME